MKFNNDLKKHIKLFVKYYSNGSLPFLVNDVLDSNIDYHEKLKDKDFSKLMVYSIYLNNLKQDKNGTVLNHRAAMRRAAQKIRKSIDTKYSVDPKFEKWEMELF